MSLLQKRRSRSETRKETPIANILGQTQHDLQNEQQHQQQQRTKEHNPTQTRSHLHLNKFGVGLESTGSGSGSSMGRRKTSAELISEAKSYLGEVVSMSSTGSNLNHMGTSVGGVRLISTRRPITPREPGRVLYGKVALAGRPPSAFSMRYLQNENRAPKTPPALEPLKLAAAAAATTATATANTPTNISNNSNNNELLQRAQSFDFIELTSSAAAPAVGVGKLVPPRKLPALALDHRTNSGAGGNGKVDIVAAAPNVMRKLPPTRNGDLLTQSNTETLIEMLKQHAGLKDCTEETVNHINAILVELYTRVRRHEKHHFKRGFILGGLYGLVECTAPKILLAVARVVLALRVTGSNLTGACKLIFKVARHEHNDNLFHDNDLLELLIDGLGHASPLDDPEACIYGYGSIRFLTTSSGQERRSDANMLMNDATNKNWSDCLDELSSSYSYSNSNKPATAPPAGAAAAAVNFRKLNRQYTLVERLARHGAVELMILHLQILNESGASRRLTGPPLHTLYQLSAALRALADVRQTNDVIERERVSSSSSSSGSTVEKSIATRIQLELACPHLIRAAEVSMGELEVQANIVRTLSVLSEDNDCCLVLVNYAARIGMLLGPCAVYDVAAQTSEKLLVVLSRLGYILGNILAKHDGARIQYYHNDVAMEYLLNVLDVYSKAPLTLRNSQGDTVIDVLVKMIRVVANMSVNAEVGFGLGNTRTLGAVLLNLLNAHTVSNSNAAAAVAGSVKTKSDLQELLHATLGALHNLCFYQDKNTATPAQVIEAKGSLQSILSDLATALCIALRSCPLETTKVEIARVLGNLTRNEKARRYFCRAGGLPLIVQHLTRNPTQDYDLKACAIGVLVNLLGDSENRAPFLQLKGAEVLTLLLRGALEQDDWFLSTIVCQAIWNVLIDVQCARELCQDCILDEVSDLLADYLDEDRIFDENDATDVLWEDFAVVATDLLERIQNNFEKEQEDQTQSSLDDGDDDEDNDIGNDVQVMRNAQIKLKAQNVAPVDDNDDEADVFIEEM